MDFARSIGHTTERSAGQNFAGVLRKNTYAGVKAYLFKRAAHKRTWYTEARRRSQVICSLWVLADTSVF